jgi:uncharacterized protein
LSEISTVRGPVLTVETHAVLQSAACDKLATVECSLDLGRSTTSVSVFADHWIWREQCYPYLEACKDRTIYYWDGQAFQTASRYTASLIKLVPTEWGAPTFEIDGIKMLPTAQLSPYVDAQNKVELIEPRGKVVLDTCGGLGYFAACCLEQQAMTVQSFEKNADVIWLRSINPWSPLGDPRLTLTHGDISACIAAIPDRSIDAILHDPPRFGIAGELYSQVFYDQLARAIKPRGKLFHYTGTPNKLTSGRDVPREVAKRLEQSGFKIRLHGDGVLAIQK